MKLKHRWIALTALCLSAALLLSSCGTPGGETPPPAAASESQQESTGLGLEDRENMLGELLLKGEHPAPEGVAPEPYTYCLPQILDDTQAAQEFNSNMQKLGARLERGGPDYGQAIFRSFWNDTVLSLVVELQPCYVEGTEYLTANYDAELGKMMTNQELLAYVGSSEETFLTALRRSAVQSADRTNAGVYELYGDSFDMLADLRGRTISNKNLELEELPLFLDDMGRPSAAVMIGTPAGGGWFNTVLTPVENKTEVRKKVDCEFMTAELDCGHVSVTFRNEGLAGLLVPDQGLEFDRPYEVEGLYGNYTDLALGFMGNGGYAYLLLTDDTGHLTACSLMNGMVSGPRFIAVGPLQYPEQVETCEFTQYPDGTIGEAVLEDGSRVELSRVLESAEHILHYALRDREWTTQDGSLTISFQQDTAGVPRMLWTGTDGGHNEGRLDYLGMTAEGLHYSVYMMDDTGGTYGMLTLICGDPDDSGQGNEPVVITWAGEDRLRQLPQEDQTQLRRSWNEDQ